MRQETKQALTAGGIVSAVWLLVLIIIYQIAQGAR